MVKQVHMFWDVLLSGIIFLLFLTLLFFIISRYTNIVQKYQHNQSDKTLAVRNKSLFIPKVELHKVPEKINQLLKDWNIMSVYVLTKEEVGRKIQRYSDIMGNFRSSINSLR